MGEATEQTEIAAEGRPARQERRHRPRFACNGLAEALVQPPGMLVRGEIHDISQTGCLMTTRAHLKLRRATRLELRLVVNGKRYSVNARVTDMRSGGGIGMEFLPDDGKAEEALTGLIEGLSAAQAAPAKPE